MTITEALKLSKENGRQYSRMSGGGWVRYKEEFTYKLDADDLLADDWEDSAQVIETVTKGRWRLATAEPQSNEASQ